MTKKVLIGVTVDHAVPYHGTLAERLAEQGWDVHFVSTAGPNLEKLDFRITRHAIEMARQPNIVQDFKSAVNWARVVGKVKPDLVIVGTPKASLLGIFVSRIFRVPARVYWVHGLRLETAEGWFLRMLLVLEKFTSKNATHLISVSKSLSDRLIELNIAPSAKITMIGSGSTQGVDLKKFQPLESGVEKKKRAAALGLDPEQIVIGFVGRLTTDKGLSELKDALLALHSKGIVFQVLLVGDFEDQESIEIVAQLEEQGVPTIKTGQVKETSEYFRVMDLFCLPSYREGLPNVVLEAFASGIPVVGTRVTGISDLISDGDTGLLVPTRDHAELEKAIESIISNQALSSQLSQNGLKYVYRNFDSERVVANQLRFFETVVD